MTTTVSVLSYVEIVEGKSSTENRRQRSTVKDINNIDYPRVEEQADSKRRVKTSSRNLDIGAYFLDAFLPFVRCLRISGVIIMFHCCMFESCQGL
jgi:hypothetical protein